MTQSRTLSRPAMPGITPLVPGDVLRVDAEPLLRLRLAEGALVAAERVALAREVIADCKGRLWPDLIRRDFAALGADVRQVAAVASPIGLTDLITVAGHVQDCLGRNDAAALGATVARLARLCDQALDLTSALRPM
jgi:hypothetical protein